MANQPISPPARNSTLEIERIRYNPEWEIPTNYPPRKPENPFLAKIKSSFVPRKPLAASSGSLTPTIPPATAQGVPRHDDADNIESKETLPPSTSTSAGGQTPVVTTKPSPLDRFLPPEKTYLNDLTRRAFLLLFLLFFLLLLVTLSLGLGLGLGLGLKHQKTKSIPLPWSSAGKGVQQGELTYYSPSLGAGACGWQNSDNDSIVAISHVLFDAGLDASGGSRNANENVLCGRMIRVWEEGREDEKVEVEVVDRCVGCEVRDLDLAEGVFGGVVVAGLGGRDRGRVRGRWEWA